MVNIHVYSSEDKVVKADPANAVVEFINIICR